MKINNKISNLFNKSTLDVAKNLLGAYLVRSTSKEKIIGKIVETEAYLFDDAASHSYKGLSERNKAMFSHPGRAYVYLVYGMYECFNCTTNKKGVGEAVLIRALEPVFGIEKMKRNRRCDDIKNLCSGPGKLTSALGITRKDNFCDLTSAKSRLRIEIPSKKEKFSIVKAKRIGITKGVSLLYRFYIKDNQFVSKK